MRQKTKMIEDLSDCLKIINRDLKTPRRLDVGREYPGIKFRPRELVGLFLVCAVGRFISPNEEWTIAVDPEGGDGIIGCTKGYRKGESFALEQVYISSLAKGNLTTLVLKAISNKSSKGSEYGKDRHLVVFCNRTGKLDHQKIKTEIADNNIFHSYWVIGKYSPTKWDYLVLAVKTTTDPVVAYKVSFVDNFSDWVVKPLGRL